MKKFLTLVLALMLAMSMIAFAVAEEATTEEATEETATEETTEEVNAEVTETEEATAEETAWYELSDEGILTVRLAAEDEGYAWSSAISDETVVELVTDATENAEYAASFKGVADATGDVTLTLTYSDGTNTAKENVLALTVDETGAIQVTSVTESTTAPDWCESPEEAADTLVVRVPENSSTGYSWNYTIADESLVVLDSSESVAGENAEGLLGVPGEYVARFSCLSDVTGETTITMTYVGPDGNTIGETRTIEVSVDGGVLSVVKGTVATAE